MDDFDSRELATLLYDRLRNLARAKMAGERGGHTLDPTGLANEAILRVLKIEPSRITGEQHFLALVAEAMRKVLVDHARKRNATKRGGGVRREEINATTAVTFRMLAPPDEILSLSEAIEALEKEDAGAATIVKLRAFAGMETDEIAALLEVSRRTVERRWRFAMADLRRRLSVAEASKESDDP